MEETLPKRIRNLIASRIGLLVREQDDALLRQVVAERVRALHLTGAAQYGEFLASQADLRCEREALATLLTVGETYFFRDLGQHALLQNSILPDLLVRRQTERTLRIWCAGCSSGEEAYSLAILLDELLPDPSPWKIFILGTDINPDAIEKAKRGLYTEWSFRGMSSERRQRYFRQHENTWVLADAIRHRVTFQTGDLVADPFPDESSGLYGMDLILCRNTFIYMVPQVVSRIADKFTETLAEGGLLITGHGELYAHHLGKLRARVFSESLGYQKVSESFCLPAARSPLAVPRIALEQAATVWPAQAKINAAAAPPSPPVVAARDEEAVAAAMQQAWQLANQGERDRAAQSCNAQLAKNPLLAEPHYLLALLAQDRGDFAEARKLLKKVIYLDPSLTAAYLDLGDLYAREGDTARACKMRLSARDLLKALPGEEPVRFYGPATANAVLQYVVIRLSMLGQ